MQVDKELLQIPINNQQKLHAIKPSHSVPPNLDHNGTTQDESSDRDT